MKKAIALLLALMVVMSLTLVAVACDEEEGTEEEVTTESVESTDSTEATDAAIDWSEAGNYEGSVVTVKGTVAEVDNMFPGRGIAKVIIRLGGVKAEDHFNIAITLNADGTFPAYAAAYESMLDSLVGMEVEVTGTIVINSFESAFEINLNDADGDTTPDDAPNGTLAPAM